MWDIRHVLVVLLAIKMMSEKTISQAVMTIRGLSGILKQWRTRAQTFPPPLNISFDLGAVTDGDQFHVVDRSNVSILLSPDTQLCHNKLIFVITSAGPNRHLRNNGMES